MLFKSLFRLVGKENRSRIILLQFLFLITALFQIAGVAAIAPFITMVSNPEQRKRYTKRASVILVNTEFAKKSVSKSGR